MKKRFFSAVLSAFLLTVSTTGLTAFAEESSLPEATESATEEILTESVPTSEAPVSDESSEVDLNAMFAYMEGLSDSESEDSATDYYADDYYDTKGNATLIKSEQIIYDTEEMQFIAVTTKDGNVFYVLINYSAENGEDNVYFLNKVDAVDLYSLIYMTDEEEENGVDMDNVTKAEKNAQKALGNVNSSESDTDTEDTSDEDAEAQNQPVKKQTGANSMYLIIGVVAILGIGGAGFLILKKKSAKKGTAEMEDDEEINFYDDDEEINEEEE